MIKNMHTLKGPKRGIISFEMIFGITALIFVVMFALGLFTYTYPRMMLEKYTAVLAQQAKVNGGLTAQNVQDFNAQVNGFGFRSTVNAYTDTGSALNVAPKGTQYDACTNGSFVHFVSRESGKRITVQVVIKANDSLLNGALSWFRAGMLPDEYTLTEVVISERNRC